MICEIGTQQSNKNVERSGRLKDLFRDDTMVIVKFFAGFREKIGKEEIKIEIADTTIEGLISLLDEQQHLGVKELISKNGVTIAVNRNVATLNDPVKNSDEVAIFPPVSGG